MNDTVIGILIGTVLSLVFTLFGAVFDTFKGKLASKICGEKPDGLSESEFDAIMNYNGEE